MVVATRLARIVGPIAFTAENGAFLSLPLGPCLMEGIDANNVGIFWGSGGELSVVVPVSVASEAARNGHLVLVQ